MKMMRKSKSVPKKQMFIEKSKKAAYKIKSLHIFA
jgi:hypothetical protein